MLLEIDGALVENIVENMTNTGEKKKTGFIGLDELTGGFEAGQLVVMGGRPCMGKTAFACSLVDNVCINGKKTCVYISSEHSKEALVKRLIYAHGNIDSIRIKTDSEEELSDSDLKEIEKSAADISRAPLWIDDTPAPDADDIYNKCAEIIKENTLEYVIVDYLQILCCKVSSGHSRRKEEEEILIRLKDIAVDFNCVVFVLSQLNRSVERRKKHFPCVADFPSQEALDKYADVILFLYRPHYYYLDEDEKIATVYVSRSTNKCGVGTSIGYYPECPGFGNI